MQHKFNIGDIISYKEDKSVSFQISRIDDLFYYDNAGINISIEIADKYWESIEEEDILEQSILEILPKPTIPSLPSQGMYTDDQIRDIAHRFYQLGKESKGCSQKVINCVYDLYKCLKEAQETIDRLIELVNN
jgi:hypothetical protein